MLTGSCLCGGVKYEIDTEIGKITACHCSLCRKMSGSAFSSGATIPARSFQYVAGKELLKQWESSPGYFREFCWPLRLADSQAQGKGPGKSSTSRRNPG